MFFTAMLLASAIFVNAQAGKSLHFSIGPELGFTTGDFNNTHSFGIGLNLTGEYMFDKSISGTIASGFLAYSGKKVTINNTTYKYPATTIIPIRAGIRYYLGQAFYAASELGLGIITGSNNSTTAFGYSLGLGTKVKTGSKNLDLGVKYDAYSKSGTLGAMVFKAAFVL